MQVSEDELSPVCNAVKYFSLSYSILHVDMPSLSDAADLRYVLLLMLYCLYDLW